MPKLPSAYANQGLLCDGQCYTQVAGGDILYIYGAYNLLGDDGLGQLLKFNFYVNEKTGLGNQSFVDINNYEHESNVLLSHSCVTSDNDDALYIVSGYDGKSTVPWHNIQKYIITHDIWDSNFASVYEPRIDPGCIVVNDILYIFGGWTDYKKAATKSIETLNLNTEKSAKLSVSLENARVGAKVLVDNSDRIWIIGGRNEKNFNIPDVEIYDTNTGTMLSTDNPIKYASTLTGADYSAAWFDAINDIMFVAGGYDGTSVKSTVQYLSTDVIGELAFPTASPS